VQRKANRNHTEVTRVIKWWSNGCNNRNRLCSEFKIDYLHLREIIRKRRTYFCLNFPICSETPMLDSRDFQYHREYRDNSAQHAAPDHIPGNITPIQNTTDFADFMSFLRETWQLGSWPRKFARSYTDTRSIRAKYTEKPVVFIFRYSQVRSEWFETCDNGNQWNNNR